MNHVKIVSNGFSTGTQLYLDGKPLDNVVNLRIECAPQAFVVAEVTMRCYVDEIDIEGDMQYIANVREVAKMTDVECIERAMVILGERTTDALREALIRALAEVAKS